MIDKMTVESSFFSQPFSNVYVRISVCIFLDMFTCFYVCLCLCVYLSMFLCVYVCVCVCVVSLFIILSFHVQDID